MTDESNLQSEQPDVPIQPDEDNSVLEPTEGDPDREPNPSPESFTDDQEQVDPESDA